jgi:hypothetical protein
LVGVLTLCTIPLTSAHLGPNVEFVGLTQGLESLNKGGNYYYYINFVRVTRIVSAPPGSLNPDTLVSVEWDSNQGSVPIATNGTLVDVYGEYLGSHGGEAIVYLEIPLPVHFLKTTSEKSQSDITQSTNGLSNETKLVLVAIPCLLIGGILGFVFIRQRHREGRE